MLVFEPKAPEVCSSAGRPRPPFSAACCIQVPEPGFSDSSSLLRLVFSHDASRCAVFCCHAKQPAATIGRYLRCSLADACRLSSCATANSGGSSSLNVALFDHADPMAASQAASTRTRTTRALDASTVRLLTSTDASGCPSSIPRSSRCVPDAASLRRVQGVYSEQKSTDNCEFSEPRSLPTRTQHRWQRLRASATV